MLVLTRLIGFDAQDNRSVPRRIVQRLIHSLKIRLFGLKVTCNRSLQVNDRVAVKLNEFRDEIYGVIDDLLTDYDRLRGRNKGANECSRGTVRGLLSMKSEITG
jgi:hypothetical protein